MDRVSNYELTKRRMAAEFAKYDQAEMLRKFRLDSDGDYLYLRFLSRPYRVHRREGTVSWSEDGFRTAVEAGFNEAMTLYDVLCCSKPDCAPAGELVNLRSLGRVGTIGTGSPLRPAGCFDGRERELARACERLGGTRYGKGDVACRLPLFDFLPVAVQFWSADEDFPSSLELLWDKNILDFMHYETVWYAAGHLLARLRELCGQ